MSTYTIPSVVETTTRGERVSDIFSRLLSARIVFVGTPIDDGVANVVMAQILHLAAASPADIHLYINSPGEGVLAHHTGRTADEVRDDTDRALVLWGDDAVAYGLADQILDRERSGGHEQGPPALRP